MRKTNLAKKLRRNSPAEKPDARGLEVASFLVGIFVMMLALGLFGNEINALLWRVRAKLFFVEGVARVEKTEIIPREGAFEVEVTEHLEKGGRKYGSIAWIDRDNPSSATREEAEKRQARFEVGRLYRCWYRPDDLSGSNELTPDGLELVKSSKRIWMPLAVFSIGWLLCRGPWHQWKSRSAASPKPLA